MAVITVNYKEPNPETYESVEISYDDLEKRKVFSSGNFIKDWYNLNKWVAQEMAGELSNEIHFSNSSSLDHFITDGANVVSRYLKMKGGKPQLEKEYDFMDEGIELFIPSGEDWTWEQLKNYIENDSRIN